MQSEAALARPLLWTCPGALWGLLGVSVLALGAAFYPALAGLGATWASREGSSFGFVVPLLAAFLLWQRRERLAATPFEPSRLGVALLGAGLVLGVLARLATAITIAQYAFVASLAGLALALVGRRGFA